MGCITSAHAGIIIPGDPPGCVPVTNQWMCGPSGKSVTIDAQNAVFCNGTLNCVVNSSGTSNLTNTQTVYCNADQAPSIKGRDVYCVPQGGTFIGGVKQTAASTAAPDGTPLPTAVIRDANGTLTPCIGNPTIVSNNVITCQPTNH